MNDNLKNEIRDGMLEYDKMSVNGSTIHNFYGVVAGAILVIIFFIKDLLTREFWNI